jgi:hypothetical protein
LAVSEANPNIRDQRSGVRDQKTISREGVEKKAFNHEKHEKHEKKRTVILREVAEPGTLFPAQSAANLNVGLLDCAALRLVQPTRA